METNTSVNYQRGRAALGNVIDITGRKEAEEKFQRNNDTQTVINTLLQLSLTDTPLEEILKHLLKLIVHIPWLALEQRGAIFLVEEKPDILIMKAQSNLGRALEETCAQVPFGRCLCGHAASAKKPQFTSFVDQSHEIRYDGIIPHGHYCVPILFEGEVLGVITTYTKEGHCYENNEEVFLINVANVLAGSIKRKQSMEALVQSEIKYRELAGSITDVFFALDKELKCIYWNNSSEKITGILAKDVLGKRPFDFFPDVEATREIRQKCLLAGRTKKSHQFFNNHQFGGKEFTLEISVHPSGNGVSVFAKDITENRRAEKKLEHAAEEWVTTFDSITDLISIHDKDFRIVRANKATADALKMEQKELVGKKCYEVFHGTTEPIPDCPHQITLKTGKSAASEFFEPHLGIHLEVTSSPVLDNKIMMEDSVHITRDITMRKNMEEQLIFTDRLASIGQLVSGVAHELNNPLTGVIGFSELLLGKNIPDEIKEDLITINRDAKRAANVVKGLLTLARGKGCEKALVDINSIIQETLQLRSYEQRLSNIKVDTRFASDLPRITGNGPQIEQVFINLIVNAEQAMLEFQKQGTITISTERAGDMIRVTVSDDGPGISPENIKKLFTPFFTTKEVGKGTGLGLSISHGIVSEHGGRIYVASESGKGANFFVEFPIVAESGQLKLEQTSAVETKNLYVARILVVDDDPLVLQYLMAVFAREGHEAKIVDNGYDALEILSKEEFDVVLLDIKMPDISGINIYEALQANNQSLIRKIIFITGDILGTETEKFIAKFKPAHINKPFDVARLMKEIDIVVNQ